MAEKIIIEKIEGVKNVSEFLEKEKQKRDKKENA